MFQIQIYFSFNLGLCGVRLVWCLRTQQVLNRFLLNLFEPHRISFLKCECPNYLSFIWCFTNLQMHEFQEFKIFLEVAFIRCHFRNVLCILERIKTLVIIMGLLFKIIRKRVLFFQENLLWNYQLIHNQMQVLRNSLGPTQDLGNLQGVNKQEVMISKGHHHRIHVCILFFFLSYLHLEFKY